jgi:hypothetical protein
MGAMRRQFISRPKMVSIERSAYPRFPRLLTIKDVQTLFTPRQDEIDWATRFARSVDGRLALLVQLKRFPDRAFAA